MSRLSSLILSIHAIIFRPRRALQALVMDSLYKAKTDYLVIGHITQDLQSDGSFRLGGTVVYSGLTAKALGHDVRVLTSAPSDLALDELALLNTKRVPSAAATVFRNVATEKGRMQYLYSQASRISSAMMPDVWAKPAIVHIAPVFHDVDPAMLALFPNSLVCLTPQGWMRQVDEKGLIHPKTLDGLEKWLSYAQICVLSREDLQGDMSQAEHLARLIPVFVVTERDHGARVYWQGKQQHFPAPPMQLTDDTGAGDIFAACFFHHFYHHKNAFQATRFAVELASRSITREWLQSVPTQEEIKKAKDLALEQALYG